MKNLLHTFHVQLNFEILNKISALDRFGGEWIGIERREGIQTLKQLKSIATVSSVGASTRIEGSKMTNDEIREFIFTHVKIEKLEDRDQQEVLGYYNVLDLISESYTDIDISENGLKYLHHLLLKYSHKDQYHRGKYKLTANSVEASHPDGSKTTIFKTSEPGIETEDSMRALIEWYRKDNTAHALIKSAVFVYEFLSIHPFQDGNGRLSRLIASLLLLKNGYPWIQYVSFEHEIEQRKAEYYQVLMDCQQQRPGEDITSWILFFLDCLYNIQEKLKRKLDQRKSENQLSPRDKMIYMFIDSHPGCKSGEISKKLNIPLPTIKKLLSEMIQSKLISKYGNGPGTNYTTEKLTVIKTDIALKFEKNHFSKSFTLLNRHSFITIKKIILIPLFDWKKPDEWTSRIFKENPELHIECKNKKGDDRSQLFSISGFISPIHYQPVFTFSHPIHIPMNLWEDEPRDNEFPIEVTLTLKSLAEELSFDVMLVYDGALEAN
ncbi:MAG: Fic family protein [Flavobacteriales bacterium]|nr:Fic family protein [Flavobacteriales bacterium]